MGYSLRRQCQRGPRLLWGVVLGFVAGGLFLGCGRGTFIGRQYDDLTAYYNTFYNAQKAFEKGVESASRSGLGVDRTRYISIFPTPQSGSGGSSFEKAIQKSADVLREHPNSEWVDDALMLIGRARYYQQNYAGAAQKFREVIALGNDRVGEARFRLAKTLVAADRFSEAAEALRTGLKGESDYGTWTAQMRLVRGELYVRQQEWTDAEAALSNGLEGPLPDDVGGRAAFLLGQVRETLDDFKGAQAAYERVLKYDPPYSLEFAARLGAIEMQGRYGKVQRALRRLDDLERDDDTRAMRGQIAIVRARLYKAMDRPKKAKQVLTGILRGEEAPTGKIQGRIHYDLATLYRDTYEDFTRAAAHFDTAATTLRSSGQRGREADETQGMLPRAPSDAAVQAERFKGLANRAQTVARLDSLLRLGRLPRTEFRAVVKKLRRKRLKEQQQEAEAQRRQQQQFRGRGQRAQRRQGEAGPSQKSAVQTRSSDAGFLFHRDPALVQQGQRQFEQTWGDRPLVDNWRRVNAIQSGGGESTAAQQPEGRGAGSGAGEKARGQFVDVSAVPRDSASRAKMEAKRAVAQYKLANALFRAAGRPDSAETWFRRILEENAGRSVARKALYGLAQAYRAQGDTAAAEEAYRRILEKYPGTPYAKRAREQLGRAPTTPVSDPEASQADSAYGRAYEAWRRGASRQALSQFFRVARRYPKTATAPRALLAAGVVYYRAVQRDTSNALQARFEQYVDSLAQTRSPKKESQSRANAPSPGAADTTRGRPSSETASAQHTPWRAPDTTAAPQTPSGGAARSQRDPGDVPGRPKRVASDSVQRDTTRRTPSSRPAPARLSDSIRAPSQQHTAALRDTTTSPPRPDSTATPSDSVATTISADSDTSRTEGPTDPFEALLTHLTKQYSESPVANRARMLLDHLKKRRMGVAPERSPNSDSTAASVVPNTTPSGRPPSPSDPARREDSDSGTDGTPGVQAPRADSVAAPPRDSTAAPRSPSAPRLPADTTRDDRRNPE